jgi:hypothetical protein
MDTLDVTYPSSGDRQLDYFHVGHCELCCRVWLIFAVSTLWFSHLSIAAFLVVGCWKDQVLMAELEIPEPSLVFAPLILRPIIAILPGVCVRVCPETPKRTAINRAVASKFLVG